MSYILLSEDAHSKYSYELESLNFQPIPLPADKRLNKIVQSHADTLIFQSESTLIANADYITAIPHQIAQRFIAVPEAPIGDYPSDTIFNALTVGRYMFAREAGLAPSVKKHAASSALTLVNVNQGYAKCSTLALSAARAAVTADKGMAAAMESVGITVLRISCGHIALDGCNYGFIGGTSFVVEPGYCRSLSEYKPSVFFFGDINGHPDGNRITEFITRLGYRTVCLSGELTDFGGAVII